MESLAKVFRELTADEKRHVHLILCDRAVTKWREYCSAHRQIHYVESVCGTQQTVDTELPIDAFHSAREGRDIRNVAHRYQEPITALLDDDLTFPDSVSFAYYSLYNLFSKYAAQKTVDDWLIVTQSLSSEQDASRWWPLFESAIRTAK